VVCEIEFELVRLRRGAAEALAARWVRRHGLWWDVRTKSERGFAWRWQLVAVWRRCAPSTARWCRRAAPRSLSVARVMAACLAQAHAECRRTGIRYSAARAPAISLRVALRRLRTALRLLAEWSPDAAQALALEAGWQAWFTGLGGARDADAIEAAFGPALREALRDAALPPINTAAAQDSPADPGAALRDPAFTLQVLATLQLAFALPAPLQTGEALLRDSAAQVLQGAWRAARRDARRFDSAGTEARHRLRKRLKRLRYAAEFLLPAFAPARGGSTLKPLRAALEALGNWNDLQVAQAHFARQVESDPQAWFAVGWLAAQEPRQTRRCSKALLPAGRRTAFLAQRALAGIRLVAVEGGRHRGHDLVGTDPALEARSADQRQGCSLTLASTSAMPCRCSVRCSCSSASMPEVSIEIRRCMSSTTARVPAGSWAGSASILPTAPKNSEPNSSNTCTPGGRSARGVRLDAEQRAHAVDEEGAGQQQPDFHRHHQVEDHRHREGADQDGAVLQAEVLQPRRTRATRPMFQATNSRMPASAASGTFSASGAASSTTASTVNACTMPATGLRGAGAHVGHGARDGAGGRDAAEQRRDEVGDALRHQLLVGVVSRELGHVVGHARAQQRLDRPQQRDRHGGNHQLLGTGPAEVGQGQARQAAGCRRSACRWSPPAGSAA
jgi:CHAD domain-containing protein